MTGELRIKNYELRITNYGRITDYVDRLGANLYDRFPLVRFSVGLQMDYDLDIAEDEFEEQIKKEIQPLNAWG